MNSFLGATADIDASPRISTCRHVGSLGYPYLFFLSRRRGGKKRRRQDIKGEERTTAAVERDLPSGQQPKKREKYPQHFAGVFRTFFGFCYTLIKLTQLHYILRSYSVQKLLAGTPR